MFRVSAWRPVTLREGRPRVRTRAVCLSTANSAMNLQMLQENVTGISMNRVKNGVSSSQAQGGILQTERFQ